MVRLVLFILLVLAVSARLPGGAQAGGHSEPRVQGRTHPTCATPGPTEEPVPLGIRIPPLPPGQRPNFIVILTDDQGYDDLGINNPEYVQTPNLDRFHRASTRFDNFYVAPQCAPTRAALLTGRDYLRTGTVKVTKDWHHINRDEQTMGDIFSAAGYHTSHFGKWHNGDSLGYEAYQVGFQESWVTSPEIFSESFQHNGEYIRFKRALTHQHLTDIMLAYLRNITKDSSQPFLMFYPTYLMHDISDEQHPGGGVRPFPPWYLDYFTKDPKYSGAPPRTVKSWAVLKYLDDVMGRLLTFLDESGLSNTTYVMITGDNGSDMLRDERRHPQFRMPSGMQGGKSSVLEGGIRNVLAVRGPGIPAGVVDSTMLSVTDILPTLCDLAGIPCDAPKHLPFDGISFHHQLLKVPQVMIPIGRRGTSLATQQQQQRMLFHFDPVCWDTKNMVPVLSENRKVWKGQPLLSYGQGGADPDLGLSPCIAVTYTKYHQTHHYAV